MAACVSLCFLFIKSFTPSILPYLTQKLLVSFYRARLTFLSPLDARSIHVHRPSIRVLVRASRACIHPVQFSWELSFHRAFPAALSRIPPRNPFISFILSCPLVLKTSDTDFLAVKRSDHPELFGKQKLGPQPPDSLLDSSESGQFLRKF